MRETVEIVVKVVFYLGIVPLTIAYFFWRSNSILRRWADRHGYRILSKEFCVFDRGPFPWKSSKRQIVYRVLIEDSKGLRRRGYVLCGDRFRGFLSDAAEVRWDE
jgi:hypothetical protein